MSNSMCGFKHRQTQWVPDRDDPGCEDGHWLCLDCGATKERAYRPFLEQWVPGVNIGDGDPDEELED